MTCENNSALLNEFIDESEEALKKLPSLLVKIENNGSRIDLVNDIFRPVHSLKGNAAYFGLLKTKTLAHELETVLDKMRQQAIQPNQDIVSVLLEGIDELLFMLDRARKRLNEIDEEHSFNLLLERVRSAAESSFLPGILKKIHSKVCHLHRELENSNPALVTSCSEILAMIDNAQNKNTVPEANNPVPEYVTKLSNILNKDISKILSENESITIKSLLDTMESTIKGKESKLIIEKMIEDYQVMTSTVGFDALLQELLCETLQQLCSLNHWKIKAENKNKEQDQTPPKSVTEKKTMRVEEERIDEFLGYVGELITVGELFTHVQNTFILKDNNELIIDEFKSINDTFDTLSRNLQKSIMEIRKVPLKNVFQKIPRIVRDTSSQIGKKVNVKINGDSIGVDKSIIDALESPIMHIVRNAVDHGIETPEKRIEKGKGECGNVTVTVYDEPDNVIITISDDGSGINYTAVKQKAVKMGLLSSQQTMDQERLIELLFASGVSTADKITDISGRGVGMDVVKKNIESVGGKITVNSVEDQGAEFSIHIPKAVGTQIINGLLIRVKNYYILIPVDNIIETFTIEKCNVNDIVGRGKCIKRRKKLLPLYCLDQLIENDFSKRSDASIAITLKNKTKNLAIGIDEVIGLQQAVLKPLTGLESLHEQFQGAAIIGNRRIALVLNTEHIPCANIMNS